MRLPRMIDVVLANLQLWASLAFMSLVAALSLTHCGPSSDATSQLRADGGYNANNLSDTVATAIKAACADSQGASDAGLSYSECMLVVAGSSVRESSWDPNKSCEDWGNSSDPACGLTQSRQSDSWAVGLHCNLRDHSPDGYKCNILTGLRNLRCKADHGTSCDHWGSGRTLESGIRKHLGGNQGVFDSYRHDMETVYNRQDIRQKLGASDSLRDWHTLLYAWQ